MDLPHRLSLTEGASSLLGALLSPKLLQLNQYQPPRHNPEARLVL